MQRHGPKSSPLRKAESVDVNERIERAFEDGRLIDEAFQVAFENAVLEHKASGHPLVFWKNGKTVLISAGDVEKETKDRKKPRAKQRITRKTQSKKR